MGDQVDDEMRRWLDAGLVLAKRAPRLGKRLLQLAEKMILEHQLVRSDIDKKNI